MADLTTSLGDAPNLGSLSEGEAKDSSDKPVSFGVALSPWGAADPIVNYTMQATIDGDDADLVYWVNPLEPDFAAANSPHPGVHSKVRWILKEEC